MIYRCLNYLYIDSAGHLHAGDLIALGSKSGSSKSTLRHPDRDDSKPSKTTASSGPSASIVPPPKKFKATISESSGGGLFSDPIRVSQVGSSQPSKTGPGAISKTLQGGSPSLSGGGAPYIEGKYLCTMYYSFRIMKLEYTPSDNNVGSRVNYNFSPHTFTQSDQESCSRQSRRL